MLEIMVKGAIPTRFQKGSCGWWLHVATLLSLMPLVIVPLLGTPTLAQESEPSATQQNEPSAAQESKPTPPQERKIAIDFEQGGKTYPAHILLDRVAIVLSDKLVANPNRYRKVIKELRGEPITGLSRNIIGIAVPADKSKDVASLREFTDKLISSKQNLTGIVDTGLLVMVGKSEIPWVLRDEIIVQIADENEPELIIGVILQNFDAKVVRKNPFDPRSFVISVPAANTLEVSNEINEDRGVSFAHPNFYRPGEWRQTSVIPNDQFFQNQWHLHNVGQGLGTEDADLDIDLAWPFSAGSPDTIIAVIDSGFEPDHPDLTEALWINLADPTDNDLDDDNDLDEDENGFVDDVYGWDFASCPNFHPNADIDHCGDNDVTSDEPYVRNHHGTAVAGAALARGSNGPPFNGHREGVVGTCPNCKLLPIRISVSEEDSVSEGSDDYTPQLAIQYAQSMGADVINISWGYPQGVPAPDGVLNAINDAATDGRGGLGAIIVIAMTNESYDNCGADDTDSEDLSSLPNVIAVGGSTNRDEVSEGGYGDCLDVLAPTNGGTLRVVTTDLLQYEGLNYDQQDLSIWCGEPDDEPGDYDYTFCFGGLSHSAPLVAGVVGLILSLDDSLTRLQVQRLLQDTADKISESVGEYSQNRGYSDPASGAPPKLGYGRINAFEAVRTIADPFPFGGRGGVDLFLRDNWLDWGNTEQLSNVKLEPEREVIPLGQSVDIKVDAPSFPTAPPMTSEEFDNFTHENPALETENRIYVRVHNRGVRPATDVRVKLLWAAHAGSDPPRLPLDFWSEFISHSDSGLTSAWHPLPSQTITNLPYSGASVAGGSDDQSAVLTFTFQPNLDLTQSDSDHLSLFAIVDSPDDHVSAAAVSSREPSFITPRDNNVSQLTIQLSE